MTYYFVSATTDLGPFHFAVAVEPGGKIWPKVNAEARKRGLVVCSDWTARPIDAAEYLSLVS